MSVFHVGNGCQFCTSNGVAVRAPASGARIMIDVANLPIWPYLAVTVPLVLTPGASTAVVLRNSVAGGTRAGVETAIGINLGSLCYGLLSAFGLALALRRWPSIWEILRIGGSLYLAWLGVQSLRRSFASEPATQIRRLRTVDRGRFAHAVEGFLTNALNPAIATFYLIVLPQFIPDEGPAVQSALILTSLHVSLAISWHLVWATAGGTLAHVLAEGRGRRVLDALAGVALLVLAITMVVGGTREGSPQRQRSEQRRVLDVSSVDSAVDSSRRHNLAR